MISYQRATGLLLLVFGFVLNACQPIQPVTTVAVPEPSLTTYVDANGLFTVEYPSGWFVQGYDFDDIPFPNVTLGSHREIVEASTAEQLLPEEQIGVGIIVLPQIALAEAGIDAETPLDEVARTFLMSMADNPDDVANMLGSATWAATTLANGTPAVMVTAEGPTEAYVMTLADLGDGLYLFAPQILALGYRNAELEAQVAAIVNSFALSASADQVTAFMMAQMATMEEAITEHGNAAPTVTFTAVETDTEYAFEGPDSISGGLTRIELVNPGAHEHGIWAVKLDEGRGFEDFLGVLMNAETDPNFPTWMSFYGGITAQPGQTAAYTIDLAEGSYALFSVSGMEFGEPDFARGMLLMLTVTAAPEQTASPPTAELRMELVDFSFVVEGTPVAGRQLIEVTNTGMEPHEIALLRLEEGVTLTEVMEFMMAGEEAEGAPPFAFAGGTGPMNAGLTAWYEVDFAAGDYGLICFIPSPANEGAPHFMLGMTHQLNVP